MVLFRAVRIIHDRRGVERGAIQTAHSARSLTTAIVLVADDAFGITNLLEDVLSDQGHTVLIATNGKHAMERAVAERPDLILTDYMSIKCSVTVISGPFAICPFLEHPATAPMPPTI
jgi:PleD family two-component response regulator